MNRREFTRLGVAGGLALYFGSSKSKANHSSRRSVAITMDDFNWAGNSIRLTGAERNKAILAALRSHSVKAALFVRGANVESDEGLGLLQAWNDAGHLIGNHSYSHWYYNSGKVTADSFQEDILRCERVLKSFSGYQKIFRFPYLKEGDTREKRDAIRTFLESNGYRNGHATIDASDWFVDERLRNRLPKEPQTDLNPYRRYYLKHIWERSQYYDDLALKVLNRPVKHTLLVHFNLLNALFLGDLLTMFKKRGWRVIDAVEAFADPVFAAQPDLVPAGESLIWALAKETGRFEKLLRYPGEDSEYEKARLDKLGL